METLHWKCIVAIKVPDRTAAAPLEKRVNGNAPLSYSPIWARTSTAVPESPGPRRPMIWDEPCSLWGFPASTVGERPPRRCCMFTDEHGSFADELGSDTKSTRHLHGWPRTAPDLHGRAPNKHESTRQLHGPARQVHGPTRPLHGPTRPLHGPTRQLNGVPRSVIKLYKTKLISYSPIWARMSTAVSESPGPRRTMIRDDPCSLWGFPASIIIYMKYGVAMPWWFFWIGIYNLNYMIYSAFNMSHILQNYQLPAYSVFIRDYMKYGVAMPWWFFLNWTIWMIWFYSALNLSHIFQNYQLPAYSVFIRDFLYTYHINGVTRIIKAEIRFSPEPTRWLHGVYTDHPGWSHLPGPTRTTAAAPLEKRVNGNAPLSYSPIWARMSTAVPECPGPRRTMIRDDPCSLWGFQASTVGERPPRRC